MQLFPVSGGPVDEVASVRRPTPFGTIAAWVEVDGAPVALTDGDVTDEPRAAATHYGLTRVEMVSARPHYPGAEFAVDGRHAWVWRVLVGEPIGLLRFVTVLDVRGDVRDAPLSANWLLGVQWEGDGLAQAIGTSDLEALAIRTGAGRWLPERYLVDADPTRPGMAPFLERGPAGMRATFANPRPGEAFEHHVALAWGSADQMAAIHDAVEAETTGILAGLRRDGR